MDCGVGQGSTPHIQVHAQARRLYFTFNNVIVININFTHCTNEDKDLTDSKLVSR